MSRRSLLFFSGALSLFMIVSSAAAAAEGPSLTDVNMRFLEQKKTTTRWGRDPFLLPIQTGKGPDVAAGEIQEPLSLSAIIYRGGQGAAIINDRIVRKGDQIEGMEVQDIFWDHVLLKEGSTMVELKVHPFLSK